MEATAKGARSKNGHTIGVTCDLFTMAPNDWIQEELRTPSLEERLKHLVSRGDGFILLPGGTGTLLELAYVLETMNKGFLPKRPVILYGKYWVPVTDSLKQEMKHDRLGTIGEFLHVVSTPQEVRHLLSQ
jgi:predicted Rossmann-fold nucleotide-binding protein